MVAVGGTSRSPIVLHRSRVEMTTGTGFRARQPYHAAVELDLKAAETFIASALHSATAQAEQAVRHLLAQMQEQGIHASRGGILLASGRDLPPLESVLASHALIHAAEGELFRQALIQGCGRCGVALVGTREREIMGIASQQLGRPASEITTQLAEMGRNVGRPWRQDEKLATLAAWLQLTG